MRRSRPCLERHAARARGWIRPGDRRRQRCGLAGPVRADARDHLAWMHREVDVANDLEPPVTGRQAP